MRYLWITLIVVGGLGCAAGVAVHPAFLKGDMSAYGKDDQQCVLEARKAAGTYAAYAGWWGRTFSINNVERSEYADCMVAKGYRRAARS
jgi:hypothetical protein